MECSGLFASNGGGSGFNPADTFEIDFETTDATPVQTVWGNLPSNGSGIAYEGRVEAVQDTGENGQYAFIGGMVARNAAGVGQDNPIVGGSAWVPPGPPFFTLAAPGWTMFLAQISGNAIRINMAGLAGQTVRWRGFILRRFTGGATP